MPWLVLIMAQAASAAAPERTVLTIPPPCEARRSAGDEIVVCARRQEVSPYRINQPAAQEPGLPKAEKRLANGLIASAETEQADIGGFPSNRFMIRLKFKF